MAMLLAATAGEPRYSVAASEGGLFADIAEECRAVYGDQTRLLFVCGRDAAERVVTWNYGEPAAVERVMQGFELLVAARHGSYQPPSAIETRVLPLKLLEDVGFISASEVRDRMRRGEPWEELVPPEIVPLVRQIYVRV
jgi:nicotinic acid mononucleotide adenylyltransferase